MKALSAYKKKRRFDRTPEPGPVQKKSDSGQMFVVQKHRASHLHYDFRLEADGVLKSWAVPKGPSLDPSTKRLAMEVEDHPVDYGDFEGIIPEGEYGGGTVMVWDTGTYEPEPETPDVSKAIKKGELKFTLHGQKLGGSWVLVRTRGRQWLLIKHRDDFASKEDLAETEPTSVFTDRTLAEIAADEGGNVEKATTGDPERVHGRRRKRAKKSSGKKSVWSSAKKKSTTKKAAAKEKTTKTARKTSRKAASFRTKQLSQLDLPPSAKRAPMPKSINPMLAKLVDTPFSGDDWLFETKWDGMRAICYLSNGKPKFVSRRQLDVTAKYPELADIPAAIQAERAIVDGEIVALDSKGFPQFQLLQPRFGLKFLGNRDEPSTIVYYVFDLIYYDGYDLTSATLEERKALLQQIMTPHTAVRYSDHIVGRGEDFFREVEKLGLEGIIAKRIDSPYIQGRSGNWLKIKTVQRTEAVIGGYTKPRGMRSHFGALVMGQYRDGELEYVGHTGGGFDRKGLTELFKLMQPLKTNTSPFAAPPKTNEEVQWIKPKLVAEVKFAEWTSDGNMRQPIFMGLRTDKMPKETVFEPKQKTSSAVKAVKKESLSKAAAAKAGSKEKAGEVFPAETLFAGKNLSGDVRVKAPGGVVSLTNLHKVYWPEDGYTKGDLLRYYYNIAPSVMPYLKDRPLILKRYPEGISGFSFHQHTVKDPPSFVKTFSRVNDDNDTVVYAVCNNIASLLYVTNLGTISLHPWSARMTAPTKPDWIMFDLDPGQATFDQVREVARVVKELLDEIGLTGYPKTSGSKGIHVYVPIKNSYTHDQAVQFATLVAHLAAARHPDLIAVERIVKKRKKGTVYLDYLQNGFGKSLAAPYSVRARPGATVSAPLEWKEVFSSTLRPDKFTIKNIAARVEKNGDLFREVLANKQTLAKALAKVEALMKTSELE
jgi:bifunctional non-homologous end joining protein LigD